MKKKTSSKKLMKDHEKMIKIMKFRKKKFSTHLYIYYEFFQARISNCIISPLHFIQTLDVLTSEYEKRYFLCS